MQFNHSLTKRCLQLMNCSPAVAKDIEYYFTSDKFRYEYAAAGLVRKHRITRAQAPVLGAAINVWLDRLQSFEPYLPAKVYKRLHNCTFSMSHMSKFSSTCEHKLCPWCQTVTAYNFGKMMKAESVEYCVVTLKGPLIHKPAVPRTPDNAVLSLRNIGYGNDSKPWLRVVYFYRGNTKPRKRREDIVDVSNYVFAEILETSMNKAIPALELLPFSEGLHTFSRHRPRAARLNQDNVDQDTGDNQTVVSSDIDYYI